jgi:hypothetical protein
MFVPFLTLALAGCGPEDAEPLPLVIEATTKAELAGHWIWKTKDKARGARFIIEEDRLVVVADDTPTLPPGTNPDVSITFNVPAEEELEVLMALPITRHFDTVRFYSYAGEPPSCQPVDDQSRPWSVREYLVVDWQTKLVEEKKGRALRVIDDMGNRAGVPSFLLTACVDGLSEAN